MNRSTLCVVLHDVAPSTIAGCERVIAALDEVAPNLPLTLLAVPRFHHEAPTAAFEGWLDRRVAFGDEIALHGWTHVDDGDLDGRGWIDRLRRRHYTRGEGEFWALSRDEAVARLAAGRAWLDARGWTAHGFVAPAWLLGPGAWAALRDSDFRYTSTLRRIHRLPDGAAIASQSLVYSTSARWRRAMSVVWNAAVAAAEAANPVLRFELHPRDADFPAVRRSWQRLLAAHLPRRRAATVAEIVASEQVEADPGGRRADRRGDQHVARIVQPEHDA